MWRGCARVASRTSEGPSIPNTFAHIELNTSDVAAAKRFYARLFDWRITDVPERRYTMLDVGERGATGGGMQKKPNGGPSAWLPYVTVASVKATLAKARKAGAQIVLPYTDIGEMGAIGVFLDPTGAALGVWEAKKDPAANGTRKATGAAKKKTAKPAKTVKPAKKAAKAPAKQKK